MITSTGVVHDLFGEITEPEKCPTFRITSNGIVGN